MKPIVMLLLLKAPIYQRFLPILEPHIPCVSINWTIEHVIPKSLIQRSIADDPENLILLPEKLNSARSNFKYGETTNGVQIGACHGCPSKNCPLRGKLQKIPGDIIFEPPDLFKPLIAHSITAMIAKYPDLKWRIHEYVMSPETHEKWLNFYCHPDQYTP